MNNDTSAQYSTYTELLYNLSHHQHSPINPQYTAVCPVIWSLSVSLSHWVSAVTGRLRSTLTCLQTVVESRYHPVLNYLSWLCLTPVQSPLFTCTPTDSRSPRVLGSAYWTAANFSPPNRNNLNAP